LDKATGAVHVAPNEAFAKVYASEDHRPVERRDVRFAAAAN
jgi:hypothetical protein